MTSGLRWLLPWPQIVQVNPAKFYPPAAELQSDNASRCSSTGLHTFWHVLLRLWWRILFVCHHSGTYCHLLLQGPRSPPLLPLLSLSVALRSPCAFFLFFVSGIPPAPLPAPVFIAFFSLSLFSSSSFSQQPWPPLWLSLIPKRVFAAFYCAERRLSPSRRHSVSAVTPCLSFLLLLFFVCPRLATFVCQRPRWWISLLEDYSTFWPSRVSRAMICISSEARDERVRLVEGCKGAFHRVNHLWCRPSQCLTADTRRVNRPAWPNSL